jgi:hypothetical protein
VGLGMDLEEEITKLKEEIKLYVAEYKSASAAVKSELRGLIKVRSEILNYLLKQMELKGKLSKLNGFKFIVIVAGYAFYSTSF